MPISLSTDITIGAIVGSTHYILAWNAFENGELVELFNHFSSNRYLSAGAKKQREVTLAFKFDVSGFNVDSTTPAEVRLGTNSRRTRDTEKCKHHLFSAITKIRAIWCSPEAWPE